MKRLYQLSAFASILFLLLSCSASKTGFRANRKYAPAALQNDYRIFRRILEADHPSIYWFTPRDSMNFYFDQGYSRLKDSMTEPEFRNILTYVADKIHCGHTSVRFSRKYYHYLDTARLPVFPFSVKVWGDSMAVVANLNRKDSLLKRGVMVRSVNGVSTHKLIDTFLNYVVSDGHGLSGKYQALSMRGSFGSLYKEIYGLPDSLRVGYSDPRGSLQYCTVPVYDPRADSFNRRSFIDSLRGKKAKDRPRPLVLNLARNVQIDTTLSTAYMTVNTFSQRNRLRSFFRKSFRVLEQRHIQDLVVDVRSNGGGDASLSTLLTRYLADKKFKLADSLYTNRRSLAYSRYIRKSKLYWAATLIVTRKRKDGFYHFGYFERHHFSPKKKHHFDGNIYLITGGNSFSATTLFVKALKGQKNVVVLGEETGGGAYGNTAWMIPEVVLPETRIRFRLPRFHLVMDTSALAAGRGIIPDIEISATPETIRRGIDPKVSLVREIILRRKALSSQ